MWPPTLSWRFLILMAHSLEQMAVILRKRKRPFIFLKSKILRQRLPAVGGTLVGFFHLFQVERGVFQCATASWMISVDYAQKGLGTEGLAAMLDFAFGPPMRGLALHRVQANIIPTNTASIRLAEKTGFRREGLAKRYLEIAGRWQDHYMYAKLAEEH
jgi:ribosomal-protein-alanine N-acetyltransferase